MPIKLVTAGLLLVLALGSAACSAPPKQPVLSEDIRFVPGTTQDFTFESGGQTLSGIFDTPADQAAGALILFVHGYGGTDIRAHNSYADLRQRFNAIGIATAVWDKPGQGRSEGTFDINQSVYSSAQEVLDAAVHLRQMKAPGAQKIGIWGISRAGWIAPIALSQDRDIDFWISVSGTTAQDNFAYLLLSNLPYEGGSAEEADLLAAQWRRGCEISRNGGDFELHQKATVELRANAYIKRMRGGWPSRIQYKAQQKNCESGTCPDTDNDMCSYIFIKDFDAMLSSLNIDTLAIFGEKDLNVDWRKTRQFYQSTIGQNPDASLKIATFKDADHNLHISKTGSIKEMQTMSAPQKADGYYDAQVDWLLEAVLDQ